MKLDIFSIDKFIEENHCLPVTNQVALYADGTPTPDGLFSEVIFGETTEDQMNKFAYIDLNGHHFVHPAIYTIISGRMKKLADIICGNKSAKLSPNNKLEVCDDDDPDAGSGLDWLYDNFDRIDWISDDELFEINSIDKKTRLQLFKSLNKDEFFVSKWLVIPRGYRDYNQLDNSLGDQINKAYNRLLQLSKSLESLYGFDMSDNATKFAIQLQLVILYNCNIKPITGKTVTNVNASITTKNVNGKVLVSGTAGELAGNAKGAMFRKNLIGTHVDFGMSSVITSPNISSADKWYNAPAPFGYAQVPLQSIVSMLFPFFIHECGDMLEHITTNIESSIPGAKINRSLYSDANIRLMLKRFTKSAANRNNPIVFDVTLNNGTKKQVTAMVVERDPDTNEIVCVRDLTEMDIVFIAANDICKNKKVLITRYPVTNNQNIAIFRIKVGSTVKTHPVTISMLYGDIDIAYSYTYTNYPYIPCSNPKYEETAYPSLWTEIVRVLICGNAPLESFGGDYDGDMLYCRCLFSDEANLEAENIINSKANYFNANGNLTRTISNIGKDALLGLYELTRNP